MASGRRRGFARERQYADIKRSQGWWVMRAPASLGAVDLVCIRPGAVEFHEIKSTSRGPFAGFPPVARVRLIDEAARAGAVPLLTWWPPRKRPVEIPVDKWPHVGKQPGENPGKS